MAADKDRKTGAIPWHQATALVHGGTLRSQFGETSEAIFLTSGYVYESAEEAEARFKGDEDGFVYCRFGNPTVAMFEDAHGRARRRARPRAPPRPAWRRSPPRCSALLKAGDRVVSARALFGSLPLHRRGPAAAATASTTTLVDGARS